MRRSRAIAVIGLVVGFSGCAGTHQCVVSGPFGGPGRVPNQEQGGPTCCAVHAHKHSHTLGQTPAMLAANSAPQAAPSPAAERAPAPANETASAPAPPSPSDPSSTPIASTNPEAQPAAPVASAAPEAQPAAPEAQPGVAPEAQPSAPVASTVPEPLRSGSVASATPEARPAAPPETAAPDPEPDPRRPIPVPAPEPPQTVKANVPVRVVGYSPLFANPEADSRRLWDYSPPDLFGVRDEVVPVADWAQRPAAAPVQGDPGPPGTLPLGMNTPPQPEPRKSFLTKFFSSLTPRAFSTRTRRPSVTQNQNGWGRRSNGVVPASSVAASMPGPGPGPMDALFPPSYLLTSAAMSSLSNPTLPSRTIPAAGDVVATRASSPSLGLQYVDDKSTLAGRPRLQTTSLVWTPGPSDAKYPAKTDHGVVRSSASRPAVASTKPAKPKPEMPGARFLRRIQGASRAFFNPELVRGETRDVPKRSDGVQRIPAHSFDEPSER